MAVVDEELVVQVVEQSTVVVMTVQSHSQMAPVQVGEENEAADEALESMVVAPVPSHSQRPPASSGR